MSGQSHRTCIRMSVQEYTLLKKKSKAVSLSANAWLTGQLESNQPVLFREAETAEVSRSLNEVGREINAIARTFNSGGGTAEQLHYAVRRLGEVYQQIYALRKKGYSHAG